MNYKIVSDSSCDLNEELKEKMSIERVPLTIYLGEEEYTDDESLDVKALMEKVKASVHVAKSACPSPGAFLEAYKGAENVFVVTMTARLSNTYSSAVMAKNMLLEEMKDAFVHVFDSKGSSIRETLICMKIDEFAKANMKANEIVEKVEDYIEEMKYFFVLGSLDTLIKNGRISKFKGAIASALKIKPILKASEEGEIEVVEKARGSNKAFKRLLELIGENGEMFEEKILGIGHCNCLEKAEKFKEEVKKLYNFKDIVIVETGGLSSVYTNEGGLLVSF